MTVKDTAICPYCEKDFEVANYGLKIPCPHCGKRLDISPDPTIFLSTPMGTVGMAIDFEKIFELHGGKSKLLGKLIPLLIY